MNKRGLLAVISILALLVISVFFIFLISQKPVCNDGTVYNSCSSVKPFFCFQGKLIENSSFCGCSNLSEAEGTGCISQYEQGAKNIILNYTLNGVDGQINFTVYKKMDDHLSSLPRYMQYNPNETSVLLDFKLRSIDDPNQKELLMPLVADIQNLAKDKDDQARIAVSLVQNIPFGSSNKTISFGGIGITYYRYPYEVLYDMNGVCGEKSELLAFLLRELGYDSAFIYYSAENHEALGIKCPVQKSLNDSGYCFIETTGPSIISDSQTQYVGIGALVSTPQIIPVPDGNLSVFGKNDFYEYNDAKLFDSIKERSDKYGTINFVQHLQYESLKKKYGLVEYIYTF